MDFPTYPTDPNETRNAQLAIFGNWILMLLGRVAFWMLLEGLSLGVSLGRAHSQIYLRQWVHIPGRWVFGADFTTGGSVG